jgi:ABC-type proline/glycine betaine transport system permease subunit
MRQGRSSFVQEEAMPDFEQRVERALEYAVFGGAVGRREFVRRVGAGTAAAALASVFPMAAAKALAQDKAGPLEKKDLKIGFIPITCATPIIMAEPMGFYKKHGLNAQAAILVIFMSSLWPTLANTAFGVASIKRDYLHVAAILQLSWPRRLLTVVLPAAAPAIVAGLRISIGSAWVAIVAAEMLIGGTGIGYFLWNEWNNLALTSVIFAILAIGVIGVLLDAGLGRLGRKLAYSE